MSLAASVAGRVRPYSPKNAKSSPTLMLLKDTKVMSVDSGREIKADSMKAARIWSFASLQLPGTGN
jgi:hypothetical protein